MYSSEGYSKSYFCTQIMTVCLAGQDHRSREVGPGPGHPMSDINKKKLSNICIMIKNKNQTIFDGVKATLLKKVIYQNLKKILNTF